MKKKVNEFDDDIPENMPKTVDLSQISKGAANGGGLTENIAMDEKLEMPVKKMGAVSRFKQYLAERKRNKAENKILNYSLEGSAPISKDFDHENRKMGEYLKDIENHILGLDEQNKLLIIHANVMNENNQVLLDQISTLKKNNDILMEQFKLTTKKNKMLSILNTVYTSLAIIFVVYRMVIMVIQNS